MDRTSLSAAQATLQRQDTIPAASTTVGVVASTHTERRAHTRADVALPATVERVGGRRVTGPATTIDLSEGGVRLRGPASFATGDVVRVTITSGDLSVANQGLVVGQVPESDDVATFNVAFRTLDERSTIDLRRLLDLAVS